jgi:hypothetical protein
MILKHHDPIISADYREISYHISVYRENIYVVLTLKLFHVCSYNISQITL